jgi:hypothetical protein
VWGPLAIDDYCSFPLGIRRYVILIEFFFDTIILIELTRAACYCIVIYNIKKSSADQ